MIVKNCIPGTAFEGKDPEDKRRKTIARFGQSAVVSDTYGAALVAKGHEDVTPSSDEPATNDEEE